MLAPKHPRPAVRTGWHDAALFRSRYLFRRLVGPPLRATLSGCAATLALSDGVGIFKHMSAPFE